MSDTVAGRYRLERRLDRPGDRPQGRHGRRSRHAAPKTQVIDSTEDGPVSLWAATDTTLHRPVCLRLVRPGPPEAAGAGNHTAQPAAAAAIPGQAAPGAAPEPAGTPGPGDPGAKAASAIEARFWQAATTAAALRHPNVAAVYDAGRTDDGRLFLVTELVDGEDITAIAGRRATLDQTAAIGIQLCRALQAAHAVGLPHLRLEPHEVVVGRDGSVRVLGFGVSAALAAPTGGGSSPYRAPEQLAGDKGGAASDLYAVGCLLYALATGAPPSGVGAAAALRALRAEAPRGLEELVADLLAADPADRPADAAEVARQLAAAMWPGARPSDRAAAGRHAARASVLPPLELFLTPPGPSADGAGGEAVPTPMRASRPYPDPAVERLAARLEEIGLLPDAARRARATRVLLVDLETALEPDHELVLRSKHRLACWVGEAGEVELAVRMLRELSATCTRLLGPTHPDTLTCRHHEADWTGRAGWPERAVELLEELEADRRTALGPDDERTLACRHNLAHWTGRSGRSGEAVMLLRELVVDCRRVLGDDHPATLAARSELAHWTGVTGDVGEAARICREVLQRRERVLGAEHPRTVGTLRELERWMSHLPQLP